MLVKVLACRCNIQPERGRNAAEGHSPPLPSIFTPLVMLLVLVLLLRRLQGQMLSKYWSADATYSLNEGMMHLKDRDSLAQLLGGVTLLASVEPTVLEITSTTDRCGSRGRAEIADSI